MEASGDGLRRGVACEEGKSYARPGLLGSDRHSVPWIAMSPDHITHAGGNGCRVPPLPIGVPPCQPGGSVLERLHGLCPRADHVLSGLLANETRDAQLDRDPAIDLHDAALKRRDTYRPLYGTRVRELVEETPNRP